MEERAEDPEPHLLLVRAELLRHGGRTSQNHEPILNQLLEAALAAFDLVEPCLLGIEAQIAGGQVDFERPLGEFVKQVQGMRPSLIPRVGIRLGYIGWGHPTELHRRGRVA